MNRSLVALAVLAACATPASRGPAGGTSVAAVIHHRLAGRSGLTKLVVERHSKLWESDWNWLHERMERLKKETHDDYVRRNAEPHDLTGTLKVGLPVVYLTQEELNAVFDWRTYEGRVKLTEEDEEKGADWFWERFYDRYPGAQGIMTLSLAGLSADGGQALVYCGNQRAGLYGAGDFYLLRRAGDRWAVVEVVEVWIS
ncbi:MAG: hypothetical protein ACYSX0_05375 [Planctomycetota bacterium]|jgi:hypothetical protein